MTLVSEWCDHLILPVDEVMLGQRVGEHKSPSSRGWHYILRLPAQDAGRMASHPTPPRRFLVGAVVTATDDVIIRRV